MSIGALGDSVSGLVSARARTGRPAAAAASSADTPSQAACGPNAPVELAPALRRRRIESVDAARTVAAMGIIVIHSIESAQLAPLRVLGMFSVPFYALLAMYFQASAFHRDPDRPLHLYLLGRLRRLYVPFVAWGAIYLVVRNLKHQLLTGAEPVRPQAWHLWVGTTHHLWFLPFLAVVTTVSALVARACARSATARWSVVAAAGAAGALLAVAPRPDWLNYADINEGYLFLQSWRALPSALLGLALGWALAGRDLTALHRRFAWGSRAAGWAGAALTAGMALWLMGFGYSRLARTLGGLGWAAVALAGWSGPVLGALARFGRYAYGAYLAHVLAIEGFQAVAHAAGFGPSVVLDVVTIGFGVTGGFGIAIAVARCKRLAWLNG